MQAGDLATIFMCPPSRYDAIFYEPNSIFIEGYIGYVVVTDTDRVRVLDQVTRRTSELLATSLI